jgi:NO-binding membrane sensor protein with MHYT domain
MALSWFGVGFHPGVLLTAWVVGAYAYLLQCLVVRRVRVHEREAGVGWLLGGALCVGTGVWGQIFLGLVAWQPPVAVGYVPAVVMGAWLPAAVVCMSAIWLFTYRNLDWRLRALGGFFVAAGLSMLCFIALSTVVTQPNWRWSVQWVVAGLAVYLVACALASVLTRRYLYETHKTGALVAVSAAVSAMFTVGQMTLTHAAVVLPTATSPSLNQLSSGVLHGLAVGAALLLLLVAHLGTSCACCQAA